MLVKSTLSVHGLPPSHPRFLISSAGKGLLFERPVSHPYNWWRILLAVCSSNGQPRIFDTVTQCAVLTQMSHPPQLGTNNTQQLQCSTVLTVPGCD